MSWALLVGLTVITVASRILPMIALPTPRGRTAAILDALPAPLFASLAAVAVFGHGQVPGLPVVLASAGALVGSTRKSLGLTLVCGIVGFVVGQALSV